MSGFKVEGALDMLIGWAGIPYVYPCMTYIKYIGMGAWAVLILGYEFALISMCLICLGKAGKRDIKSI